MATEYRLSHTAAEIDRRLSAIDNLAEKKDIPKKTSDLTNDSGFATESYVHNYAQPKDDYALKSDIKVTSVNGKTGDVNLTATDVGALPNTTVIPAVPTDVSAFNNDAGYLTEQSIDGYATELYVDNKIAEIPTPDVSGQIDAHNVSTFAHNDIRSLVDSLTKVYTQNDEPADAPDGSVWVDMYEDGLAPGSGGGAALEPTGVTAGTYGGLSSGIYNFPVIDVDEYGRITYASTGMLPAVSSKANGYMPYSLYNHINLNSHIKYATGVVAVDGETTILGSSGSFEYVVIDSMAVYYPRVFGAYIYVRTDASSTAKYWVPIDNKYIKYTCSSTQVTARVTFPDEYKAFNDGGATAVITYAAPYASPSSM